MSKSANPIQTCLECRQQKRSCDKKRPTCTRCRDRGKVCRYISGGLYGSMSTEVKTLQNQVAELEEKLAGGSSSVSSGSSEFQLVSKEPELPRVYPFGYDILPSLFFLDSGVFYHTQTEYPKPEKSAPDYIVSLLGDPTEINEVVLDYFSTIHTWLPIVSKVRLRHRIDAASCGFKADTALLILCMKLIVSIPVQGSIIPHEDLRKTARDYLGALESQNIMTIEVLQAAILIALFEIGHSMYPVAYLSTGHCVSLLHAMGLHGSERSPQMLGRIRSAVEGEERLRVCWAVAILEHFTKLGGPGRPIATRDPQLSQLLPNHDALWDEGQHSVNETLASASRQDAHVSPFARTCQVVHLLAHVKRYERDPKMQLTSNTNEANQRRRTIYALSQRLEAELRSNRGTAFCRADKTALALCYSTLMINDELNVHWVEDNDDISFNDATNLRQSGLDGLAETTAKISSLVYDYGPGVQEFNSSNRVGLFVCEPLFAAGAMCVWYVAESNDATSIKRLQSIKMALDGLSQRWLLAKGMLMILELEEEKITTAS